MADEASAGRGGGLAVGAASAATESALGSLERFASLQPEILLPGHGPPFTDVELLSDRLHSHSRSRADAIAALLSDTPVTPFDIARQLQWQPRAPG